MSKRTPLHDKFDKMEIHLHDDVIITCKKSEFMLEKKMITCIEYITKHHLYIPLTSVLYVTDLTYHDIEKEVKDRNKHYDELDDLFDHDLEETSS